MSITKEGVLARMGGMGSVVLNVLSGAEYRELHIRGSVSLPLGKDPKAFARKVEERYGKGSSLITYGSDLTSHTAIDAAQALQERGLKAEAYLSGMREWKQEGYPVEGGP